MDAPLRYTRGMTRPPVDDPSISREDPLYDLLRVAAAVAVVGIHALAAFATAERASGDPSGLLFWLDQVLFVAVPLFLFISGALTWGKREPMGDAAYRRFMGRRLRFVGIPYLAWTVIYFALLPLLGEPAPGSAAIAVERFTHMLVNGTAFYHLYFVPLLLVLYSLTPIARALMVRSPELFVLAVIAVRVWLAPEIVLVIRGGTLEIAEPLITNVLVYAPYMATGAWFALRRPRVEPVLVRAWPLPLLVGIALLAVQAPRLAGPAWGAEALRAAEYGAITLAILGLTGLAAVLAARYEALRPVGRRLAVLTYGVYLLHPLILRLAQQAVGGPDAFAAPPAALAAWILVLGASTLVVAGMRRVPVLRRLT